MDRFDFDLQIILTVSNFCRRFFTTDIFKGNCFFAAAFFQNFRIAKSALHEGTADRDRTFFIRNKENFVELESLRFGEVCQLDMELVSRFNPVLLAACLDDRETRHKARKLPQPFSLVKNSLDPDLLNMKVRVPHEADPVVGLSLDRADQAGTVAV